MDSSNLTGMRRICGGDPDGKLRLLMAYTGAARDVADPWYTGNLTPRGTTSNPAAARFWMR